VQGMATASVRRILEKGVKYENQTFSFYKLLCSSGSDCVACAEPTASAEEERSVFNDTNTDGVSHL